MSQPPSYPGSGSGENDPTGDENLPPTHSAYGQQPSYDQGAYGQQSSYGQQPYDPNNPYGAWQGGNDAGKGTDGLSIAAFVISLVCCPLGIIAAILGFIGLGRTKDGQRKGRWAAVSAIIIGIIGTLLSIGVGVAVVFVAKNSIDLDSAKVGQCANIDVDDDTVMMSKKDCSDDHDGEIVYVGKFSEIENSQFKPSNIDDVTDAGVAYALCSQFIGDKAAEIDSALDGKAEYGIANEDSSPSSDEKFLCYVKRSDDKKIDEKIS